MTGYAAVNEAFKLVRTQSASLREAVRQERVDQPTSASASAAPKGGDSAHRQASAEVAPKKK